MDTRIISCKLQSKSSWVSDGRANVDRTMANVLLKKEYPEQYTSSVSTRVSNALLVGEIIGMLVIGYFSPPSHATELHMLIVLG